MRKKQDGRRTWQKLSIHTQQHNHVSTKHFNYRANKGINTNNISHGGFNGTIVNQPILELDINTAEYREWLENPSLIPPDEVFIDRVKYLSELSIGRLKSKKRLDFYVGIFELDRIVGNIYTAPIIYLQKIIDNSQSHLKILKLDYGKYLIIDGLFNHLISSLKKQGLVESLLGSGFGELLLDSFAGLVYHLTSKKKLKKISSYELNTFYFLISTLYVGTIKRFIPNNYVEYIHGIVSVPLDMIGRDEIYLFDELYDFYESLMDKMKWYFNVVDSLTKTFMLDHEFFLKVYPLYLMVENHLFTNPEEWYKKEFIKAGLEKIQMNIYEYYFVPTPISVSIQGRSLSRFDPA